MSTALTETENTPPSFFKRFKLPIILGILAVCLYAFSILYITFGKGQIG